MEDLPWIVSFARVVQGGSFSAASDKLGLAPSVVSKHVAKLEKTLGARLLQRSTRKLSLTEAGTAYYEHCSRIVEELDLAREAVTRLQAAPRGRLRISAMLSFSNAHIAPALPEFFQRYPEIELEIVCSERLVDLAEEGYDLALRMTGAPSPSLIARRMAPIHWVVCATPAYLKGRDRPKTPADLMQHRCLGYPPPAAPQGEWHFTRGKEKVAVAVPGPLRINSIEAIYKNALADVGIALLPTYVAGESLQRGKLERVLEGWEMFPDNVLYAVYMPHRYAAPKLRAFVDFFIERFGGDEPYWDRKL